MRATGMWFLKCANVFHINWPMWTLLVCTKGSPVCFKFMLFETFRYAGECYKEMTHNIIYYCKE